MPYLPTTLPFRAVRAHAAGSRGGLEEHPAIVDAVRVERQEVLDLLVVQLVVHEYTMKLALPPPLMCVDGRVGETARLCAGGLDPWSVNKKLAMRWPIAKKLTQTAKKVASRPKSCFLITPI